MLRKEQKKPAAAWGEDVKTAVEVPTHRSQQRLKTIAKPGGGWDEDIHTVARPADAILPAAAFRDDQIATPVPQPAPSSRVVPPPLPLVAAASSTPPSMAEPEAASLSHTASQEDGGAMQLAAPRPRARLRPAHWVLVCLTAAACGVLGYAAVSSSVWARAAADRIESLLFQRPTP